MRRAALVALLSHWRRRPFQLLTLLLGLATATALWSGVQAINAEARASYDRAAGALGATPRPSLARADGTPMDEALFAALRRAGWLVTPLVEGRVETAGGSLRILGVDPFTLPGGDLPEGAAGDALDPAFLGLPGRLIVSPETAARIGGPELPPLIEVEGVAPGIAYADIPAAQALLGLDGQLSRFVLLDGQPGNRPPLDEVAPGLSLQQPQTGADMARLTDSFHLNLTAFGLLSFAVGLFIVRGTIGLAFEQRRPMFRTLRALGLPAATLLWLLLAELLVFALIAGAAGIALGYLVASALIPDVAATLRGLYGASVEGTLSIRPVWWLTGLGIAVLGTALAALSSLWQVARLPLLAPAQPRAWARASEAGLVWQGLAALGLAALSGLTIWLGSGLIAAFVMLGALLIAAALALPLVLYGALWIGARLAKRPLAQWFWADTRQQLPGLSLALMALLLALAANIGVGTMVSSFRLPFTGWLDQRLASELYVTADNPEQAERLTGWLAPRVQAILPIMNTDARIAGLPGEIYGVADDPTYRDNWPLIDRLPDVWDRVAAGDGVLINEQLARRTDTWSGGTIALPGWPGAPVVGVYSDYGNPLGQVLMGLDALRDRFPEVEALRFGLRLPRGEVAGLTRALTQDFGLSAENIVDQAALKAFSIQVFERTFTVSRALNVLTLAVAGFAILTSLLTLSAMRLPQLAPVWALGVTRRGLARLELVRALVLAGLTMLCALPVGLLLAWVLLAVINVAAFGWKLPLFLFPSDWVVLGALSLAAAGLAALWPALSIARIPPARLLQVFAHER
ncbi:FtsX-like permease family protein [Oceaniglobus roseus]|uniref:FtsX-like permease family protein n=1 Tax=Oceaniglobus roseus TaxID=1737570 RepID=UPI000C7EF158|nr:FtsX-like permease family protein [Kandeliimicrobium roseum]